MGKEKEKGKGKREEKRKDRTKCQQGCEELNPFCVAVATVNGSHYRKTVW